MRDAPNMPIEDLYLSTRAAGTALREDLRTAGDLMNYLKAKSDIEILLIPNCGRRTLAEFRSWQRENEYSPEQPHQEVLNQSVILHYEQEISRLREVETEHRKMRRWLNDMGIVPHETQLTRRRARILQLRLSGLTYQRIADEVGVSPSRVWQVVMMVSDKIYGKLFGSAELPPIEESAAYKSRNLNIDVLRDTAEEILDDDDQSHVVANAPHKKTEFFGTNAEYVAFCALKLIDLINELWGHELSSHQHEDRDEA